MGIQDQPNEPSVAGSITQLLVEIQQGHQSAMTDLVRRYYDQLIQVANRKLASRRLRVHDAEDVVVSAFASLLSSLEQGRYPDLSDREGLWFLLLRIVDNRARNMVQSEWAQKRGGGVVRGDSAFRHSADPESGGGFDLHAAATPTPEYVAMVIEKFEQFYARVESISDAHDRELFHQILEARMQGLPVAEIARLCNVTKRQVERKIERARRILMELESE